MLTTLQQAYADKPVRFLLFPCNQFDHQEPGSNADVKAFAERYVDLGPGSNVIMFAKSNLNNVPCAAQGANVCTPESLECCPTNDAVYDYLLSATPPGTIKWNFDKIVVDGSGRPFTGETIFHGKALGDVLSAAISQSADVLAESQVTSQSWPAVRAMTPLFAVTSLLAAVVMTQVKRRQHSERAASQLGTQYIMLA